MPRPGRLLPAWRQALVVVAHPDDETFGLGAVADRFTAGGTAVHVLCFTHREASTLNENTPNYARRVPGNSARPPPSSGSSQ
jgi:LmbE family N-acetylglucosaminyl deacetylase